MKDPHDWHESRHPGIRRGVHRETGAVKWRVRYRPPGGHQTSKTFDSLEAARRFRLEVDERAQNARDGRGRRAPKDTPSLRVYVEQRLLPRYGGRTGEMYAGTFRALELVDPAFMGLPVGVITKSDIEIALARHGKRYAASTTNKAKRSIMVALGQAADDGLIDRLHVRIPNRRVNRPQQAPSSTELALVLDELPDQHRVPVLVAAATGVRSGELRGLGPEDIDGLVHDLRQGWHRGDSPYRVHVRRQLDQHGRELTTPKTETSQRTVVVYAEVVEAIAHHLNAYGTGMVQGQVLLWPVGGEGMRRALSLASKRALGRSLKLHSLRRYYATMLAYGGVPVHEIQKDLGHSDPSVTMQWYTEAMQRKEPGLAPEAAAVLRLAAHKGR